MITDFARLLSGLVEAKVEFIVVGGFAGTIHGAARLTQDLDLVYRLSRENRERLATALSSLAPYPRGAPAGLPFIWDARTLAHGQNFTLATSVGLCDLLGEIAGGGKYEDLLPHTEIVRAFGLEFRCLDLLTLISTKRAAGRPKDFEAIAELELLLQRKP
jgi:hypothetical protein